MSQTLLTQFRNQFPETTKLLGLLCLKDQLIVFKEIMCHLAGEDADFVPLKRMTDGTSSLVRPLFSSQGDFNACVVAEEFEPELFFALREEHELDFEEEETNEYLVSVFEGRMGDLNNLSEPRTQASGVAQEEPADDLVYFEFSDGNTGFKVSGATREEYQDAVTGAILARRSTGQTVPDWADGNSDSTIRAIAGLKFDEAKGEGDSVSYGAVERKAKPTTFGN